MGVPNQKLDLSKWVTEMGSLRGGGAEVQDETTSEEIPATSHLRVVPGEPRKSPITSIDQEPLTRADFEDLISDTAKRVAEETASRIRMEASGAGGDMSEVMGAMAAIVAQAAQTGRGGAVSGEVTGKKNSHRILKGVGAVAAGVLLVGGTSIYHKAEDLIHPANTPAVTRGGGGPLVPAMLQLSNELSQTNELSSQIVFTPEGRGKLLAKQDDGHYVETNSIMAWKVLSVTPDKERYSIQLKLPAAGGGFQPDSALSDLLTTDDTADRSGISDQELLTFLVQHGAIDPSAQRAYVEIVGQDPDTFATKVIEGTD